MHDIKLSDMPTMLDLLRIGLSTTAIAKYFGMSEQQVQDVLGPCADPPQKKQAI